jgi:hypothetical protein
MQVNKADYIQFKNSAVYGAARQDVGEAVSRALAEMVNSEELSMARHNFLRGFIAGATSILEWEPDFIEEQTDDGLES